jgi:23S rRNA (uridine2552-2'-O)-methyltransferase
MGFKVKDHYFKKAKKENYLARSVYKLEEIDKKYNILKKGMQVLDLGYYPGSWMQYTAKVIGEEGMAIGIDIQEVNKKLNSKGNVKLFEKSIFDVHNIEDLDVKKKFDVVLSDMAPNTTGIKTVDQAKSVELVESTISLLPLFLKSQGSFVFKIFDGPDVQKLIADLKQSFKKVNQFKPKSTRSVSKEFFVIGIGYKP